MTALAPPPDLGESDTLSSSVGGVHGDRAFRAIAFAAGMLVLAILALIAYATTSKAWPAFTHEGLRFVTSRNWNPNTNSRTCTACSVIKSGYEQHITPSTPTRDEKRRA